MVIKKSRERKNSRLIFLASRIGGCSEGAITHSSKMCDLDFLGKVRKTRRSECRFETTNISHSNNPRTVSMLHLNVTNSFQPHSTRTRIEPTFPMFI
jgi:hypothetical protein